MTPEDNARVRAITIRQAEDFIRAASGGDPDMERPFTRDVVAKLFDLRDRAAQPDPNVAAEWEKQRSLQIELCTMRVSMSEARIAREQAARDKSMADTVRLNVRAAAISARWTRLPPAVQAEMIAERRLAVGA
jgi:hypothetical protein